MRDTGIAVPLIGTSRTSTRGFFGGALGAVHQVWDRRRWESLQDLGEEKGKQDGSLDLCVNLNWVEWHSGGGGIEGKE